MSIGDPYIELPDLKGYLKLKADKIGSDEELLDAIRSASEEVEKHCNRQFQQTTSASARRYEPNRCGTKVKVDDFHTKSGLVVEYDSSGEGDWVTLDSSKYDALPINGVVDGQKDWPFYEIVFYERVPVHRIDRFSSKPSVRVTAQWGWKAVPAAVRQATLIIAAETYQLRDAPFGVAGMDVFGNALRVRDNRIAAGKLARFQRNRIPVA